MKKITGLGRVLSKKEKMQIIGGDPSTYWCRVECITASFSGSQPANSCSEAAATASNLCTSHGGCFSVTCEGDGCAA